MKSRLQGWILGMTLSLLGAAAQAQADTRSFGIYSELAREVSIVVFQEATGSNLSNNLRDRIQVPNGAMDVVALIAMKDTLAESGVKTAPWPIAPLDTDLFDATGDFSEGATVKIPADLADEGRKRGISHLLLLTRVRGDAKLKSGNGTLGVGKLEGLGFYVDRQTPLRLEGTMKTGNGFIAPYVYMRLTMLDAKSGKVVRSKVVTSGFVISPAESATNVHPWEVMTAKQKIDAVSNLMRDEVRRVLPEVIGKP